MSPVVSPQKGGGTAQDAHALRQQLLQLQKEREDLLLLLEASMVGLHLEGEEHLEG